VSSFDIAQLVEPIRLEREDKKRRGKYDRGSIIGSLIDEALFEFTSLEEEAAAAAAKAAGQTSSPKHGSAPLQLGSFENVASWADDLGDLGLDTAQTAPSGDSFELGNLAALEDDPLSGRVRSEFPAATRSSRPPISNPPPPALVVPVPRPLPQPAPPPAATPLADVEYPAAKSKGGLIAVIILLVAVAGAAGAYFGGVIPH
jgi:hypothetical protein